MEKIRGLIITQDPIDLLFYPLHEFSEVSVAGKDTYEYRSKGEADYVVEQFTKWSFYLVVWRDEFTDGWIEDSIRCARRDRLLWRWCNAA